MAVATDRGKGCLHCSRWSTHHPFAGRRGMIRSRNTKGTVGKFDHTKPAGSFKPQTEKEASEIISTYSGRLCFLWEQYIKVVHLNIILSGVTIGIIANLTLLSERMDDFIEVKQLIFALGTAGISGFLALLWRFCAQVLMERQVYGRLDQAEWYFLMNNSSPPKAITGVKIYEHGIVFLKWFSGSTLLVSWLFLMYFAFLNMVPHLS